MKAAMNIPSADNAGRTRRLTVAARLFVTVFVVYAIHFSSNVVRETYLAVTLGENFSVRVDEYLGLHPDLFFIHGRGAFINSNPGASMFGAIPYALARPIIDGILRAKPDLARPKPPGIYDDPRPNRSRFMNEARRRGLDVKLGLAAASMHTGLMVPLGAFGAVVMFLFLRCRLRDERKALLLALLYAFGTPVFFRSGFLNQNAIVAHATLLTFVLLAGCKRSDAIEPLTAASKRAQPSPRDIIVAGVLLGITVLCDYSGLAIGFAFAVWLAASVWRDGGPAPMLRALALLAVGAAGPLVILAFYQWVAFDNPFLPAQAYMPPTRLAARGWHGFTLPTPSLITANLFDLQFGLFAFCPMLLGALGSPFFARRNADEAVTLRDNALILGVSGALLLFASSVQFAALQFNTGVRYMVPAVPLLFIALVPVLLRLKRAVMLLLVVPTLVISWSVSMMRESVPDSLYRLLTAGPELPWLTVLRKMSGAYVPLLAEHSSPLPLFAVVALALWFLWRPRKQNR